MNRITTASKIARYGVPLSGAAFALYVYNEYREHSRLVDVPDAALRHLPKVEDAQKTKVVAVSQLLSAKEIETLLEWHESSSRKFGSAGRTAINSSAPLRHGVWETSYLSTNDEFRNTFPQMYTKLKAAAVNADQFTGKPLLSNGSIHANDLQPRCIELHTVKPGGSLPYRLHHDHGSVLTIDIMLTDTFQGGTFTTLESDDSILEHTSLNQAGNALVFISHKPHFVQPVTRGLRRVLVLEFWLGEARFCAHRCEKFSGPCHYTLFWCFWRRALANLAADDTYF